jgi:ATP-dependent Clp protease adapter protein ClpS
MPYYNMGGLVMDTGTVLDGGKWVWRAAELGFKRRMFHFMWNLTSVIPPNRSFGPSSIKPTGDHIVVLLNDEASDRAFVVTSLEQLFGMTGRQAIETVHEAQKNGSAPIGSFSRSEAEAKAQQLHAMARKEGSPLQCWIKRPGSSPWSHPTPGV